MDYTTFPRCPAVVRCTREKVTDTSSLSPCDKWCHFLFFGEMGQEFSRWIPMNPSALVEIPQVLLEYFDRVHPIQEQSSDYGKLAILANREYPEATGSPQLFHLAFSEKDWATDVISIARSPELEDLISLWDRLRQFPELFSSTELVSQVREYAKRGDRRYLGRWGSWKTTISGYDPSTPDFDKHPDSFPLHGYACNENVNDMVEFVLRLQSVNWQNAQGNTILHMAVLWQNLTMVRFLLCMGADPNIENKEGQTPLHFASEVKWTDFFTFRLRSEGVLVNDTVLMRLNNLAVRMAIVESLELAGARRCSRLFPGCSVYCKIGEVTRNVTNVCIPTDSFQMAAKHHDEWNDNLIKNVMESLRSSSFLGIPWKRGASNVISALSLDGGGIKGLVLVQVLLALEERLSEPIVNYIDWMAGTSTGSIVSAGLGAGKSLREIQKIYLQLKDKVFQKGMLPRMYNYDATNLELFLQESLGKERTLDDILYPKMFFTTLKSDKDPGELILQRTYRLPISNKHNDELGYTDPKDTTIWRAVRRSSAAPTYFTPSEGIYLDGGMAANNPSMELLTEIHVWNKRLNTLRASGQVVPGCLISIGCGEKPECDLKWSFVTMPFDMKKVIVTQIAPTDGSLVNNVREQAHAAQVPFFRLTPKLSEDIDLASNDNVRVLRMMWDAFVFTRTHGRQLDQIAELLKIIGINHKRKIELDWRKANERMNRESAI